MSADEQDFTGHERIVRDQTLADAEARAAWDAYEAAHLYELPARSWADGQHDDHRFLDELDAVCQRYGRSLWHEDGHGAFLVVPYGPLYASVLRAAYRPSR